MAFPTIPTSAAGRVVSVASTAGGATNTFPNLNTLTKNAGDLLIAIIVIYDGNSTNAEFSSWGGGFTEFVDQATTTTMGIGCAYKWSTGSEIGTFTVTSADASTTDRQMILLSIPGAHASTPPESTTIVNGTSSVPSIPTLTPSWGAEDTLFIAVGGAGENSTSGTFTGISGAPTDFTDLYTAVLSADAVGGVEAAVAFRQFNSVASGGGNFSIDTSNARNSQLRLAVRPAAGIPQGSASGSITWAGSSTGARASSGASTGTITWAGSATGVATHQGSASGTITWAGSATGESPAEGANEGSATGSITWAGTATGTSLHSGSASGAIGWSGASSGVSEHSGAASGTISWTGTAVGTSLHSGASTGAITWAGSATGESPTVGAQEGSAEGAITWVGSATGVSAHQGAAAGNIAWTGSATGITTRAGAATGSIAWDGVATGMSVEPAPFRFEVGTRIAVRAGAGGQVLTVEGGGQVLTVEGGS